MPAEVGYGPAVNLAAEVIRPPSQAATATAPETENVSSTQARLDEDREARQTVSAGASEEDTSSGNTTEDRGQNINITV